MKKVTLVNSHRVAIVDDADYEAVSAFRWRLFEPKPGHFYARAWIDGGRESLHVLIARLPGMSGALIDHKNRDGLDNRRSNIRPATYSQNNQNRIVKSSSSGVPGVHRSKRGWIVRLRLDGEQRYFGFRSDLAAAISLARSVEAETENEWRPRARVAELERMERMAA
ncbi:MAG TPA: hypothetical protein VMA55_11255 [Acidovorax sp.]|nr:hypothetical protein [Acidovorax sp.]